MGGIEAADALGVISSYGYYLRVEAVLYDFLGGDVEAAARWLAEALARGPGGEGDEYYRLCYTLPVLVATGAPDAEATYRRARELAARSDRVGTHGPPPQVAGAELALWRHQPEEAASIALDGASR